MKKLILAFILITPLFFLSSCTFNTVAVDSTFYNPGYSNDYVYSVGYYPNRPYWGNNYYSSGYYWGANGYWGGGYYNGF